MTPSSKLQTGVAPRAARSVFRLSGRRLRLRTRLLLYRLVETLRLAEAAGPSRHGRGVVLCLHNVVQRHGALGVNRGLDVTTVDLEAIFACMTARGYTPVSLDAVSEYLHPARRSAPRFVAYTFDDGYADNLHVALPLFRRHGIPFTVFVTTGFMDGAVPVWWYALERKLAAAERVTIPDVDGTLERRTVTIREKVRAYRALQAWLVAADAAQRRRLLEALFGTTPEGGGVGAGDVLSPAEVRTLAEDPLVTVGAHTRTHAALRGLPEAEAWREIVESRERLTTLIGRPVDHFAYPFGNPAACGPREERLVRQAGFETAVTTAARHVTAADRATALPRIMLSGEYDPARALPVLLTDWFGRRRR
ncbi:MAG: polysaccharide deacetylase [candidate division NC10 bacterium]|nr:polysaccharide deacetylase [candidate division NC10 bacterium]